MIWLIYNIVNGLVVKTQVDEPETLLELQGKCKCDFVYLGQELKETLTIQSIDASTLNVVGISIKTPVENIQILEQRINDRESLIGNLETNITDLEINNIEKDQIISNLEMSVTDLEIAVLEIKAGGAV